VARQRALLINTGQGHNTTLADDMLATCEETQALHIADHDRLRGPPDG
jgi:hypothetical protein